MSEPFYSVITTIQEPTESVRGLARRLGECGGHLVIIGDSKGPSRFPLADVAGFNDVEQLSFLALEEQLQGPFDLARTLPTRHYARKNLGYLHAIAGGASCIYETDDDNAPLPSWKPRSEYASDIVVPTRSGAGGPEWVNVYSCFTDELIWPRGLPLDHIRGSGGAPAATRWKSSSAKVVWAPIQQGLADGSPDVDAIWRLVLDREFRFTRDRGSVLLQPGQWCPFNTQTTWWWPAVYPLLYIPSYCSFRMCDIWKSFIAQRCLWELGAGVVFHAPEVWQERNVHDLMRDFNDEVPGYRENHRIAQILEGITLSSEREQVGENLRRCYEELVRGEVFPAKELELVDAWIAGLKQCGFMSASRNPLAAPPRGPLD